MKQFLKDLFKDKNGNYSLREVIIGILTLIVIFSWIGQQFLSRDIPEFMFYSVISLIGAACFGYSLERTTTNKKNPDHDTDQSS
ncbi:MAG: hypothetical protein JNK08_09700 [Sediminibacterium sp.]|nr:hypothetical protein [Sediminibacterium sp.]